MSCTHRIARSAAVANTDEEAARNEEARDPARTYPFVLDEFQQVATRCIDDGESVLVCAHTSAGKTVCAEHAIAAALRDGQRVVYSSPIKALSNQKFGELTKEFGDVGLITGDTTINEEASCLVMTTEVLRVMLYKGVTAMREIKWVIFDEMHLLGNPDRGWVLEEALILLPHSVRFVLLSATVPNAFEVAEWLANVHEEPVHVVQTTHRPVPLRHYVCPAGGSGLHMIQDEHGSFDEAQWHSAVGALPKLKTRDTARAADALDPHASEEPKLKRAAEVVRLVNCLAPLGMLPAIIFCFSRKECALIATQMGRKAMAAAEESASLASDPSGGWTGLKLLRPDEVAQIEQTFEAAVSMLSDEDAELQQVVSLLPLLKTGVGLHHSGMLPVLRELVELLFAEGLLRVLIATETLAMGFSLRFSTMLKLMRTEGATAMSILTRSFRTHQLSHQRQQHGSRRHAVRTQLETLEAERSSQRELHSLADAYLLQRAELHQKGKRFELQVRNHARPWMQPGRVLRLDGHRGWAVLVSAPGLAGGGGSDEASGIGGDNLPPPGSTLLHVLSRLSRKRLAGDMEADGAHGQGAAHDEAAAHESAESERELVVVSVPFSMVRYLAAARLWMPRDLHEPDARASVALALDSSLKAFDGALPRLDPLEHMHVEEPQLLRLVDEIEAAEHALRTHPLHQSHRLQDAYERCHRIRELRLELESLDQASAQRALHSPDSALGVLGSLDSAGGESAEHTRVSCMRQMLVRLEYLDGDDVLLLKGRAACCIESADELLVVEILVQGALNDLSTAETVAVLACLLPDQRAGPSTSAAQPLSLPTPALGRAVAAINATLERLARVSSECGPETALLYTFEPVVTELVPAVLAWASGSSFEKCWLLSPNVYEGTLVRNLKTLDELLQQLADAATALGDQKLQERFKKCAASVHRGIAFANSLYLT